MTIAKDKGFQTRQQNRFLIHTDQYCRLCASDSGQQETTSSRTANPDRAHLVPISTGGPFPSALCLKAGAMHRTRLLPSSPWELSSQEVYPGSQLGIHESTTRRDATLQASQGWQLWGIPAPKARFRPPTGSKQMTSHSPSQEGTGLLGPELKILADQSNTAQRDENKQAQSAR